MKNGRKMAQAATYEFPHIPATKGSLSRRRLIYGVGTNDSDYLATILRQGEPRMECPYYKTWKNILKRAYCPKFHAERPSYIGVTVAQEWHSFMTFRKWMAAQEWEGMEIDKDILVPGNKHYGPDFCVFVSARVNTLLVDNAVCRGEWPIGVSLHKPSGKFRAQCSSVDRNENLGYFATPKQARAAYCKRKAEVITEVALEQPDQRVKTALLMRAENLLKGE